jgi:hypothetical protein
MLTERRLQCTKLPRRGRTIILRGCDEPLFTNVPEGVFSAPLCQAALRKGARESATRLLKTASEMRLLRQRSASLRDLPSASFLR